MRGGLKGIKVVLFSLYYSQIATFSHYFSFPCSGSSVVRLCRIVLVASRIIIKTKPFLLNQPSSVFFASARRLMREDTSCRLMSSSGSTGGNLLSREASQSQAHGNRNIPAIRHEHHFSASYQNCIVQFDVRATISYDERLDACTRYRFRPTYVRSKRPRTNERTGTV